MLRRAAVEAAIPCRRVFFRGDWRDGSGRRSSYSEQENDDLKAVLGTLTSENAQLKADAAALQTENEKLKTALAEWLARNVPKWKLV